LLRKAPATGQAMGRLVSAPMVARVAGRNSFKSPLARVHYKTECW
jgi:hypothetical protein